MRVAIVLLDAEPILDETLFEDVLRYLKAMLRVEIQVLDIPALPIAPKGWQALMERARQPLRSRPGRPGSEVQYQLHASQLLSCMKSMAKDPAKFLVPELEGVDCILGLTNCELFFKTDGLLPEESCPEDRTNNFFIANKEPRLGACSFARLPGRFAAGSSAEEGETTTFPASFKTGGTATMGFESVAGPWRRKFVRHLLPLVSASIMDLLGLRTCGSHTCLAYWRPFSLETTSRNLCYECEEKLLRHTSQPGASTDILLEAAADRYRDMRDILSEIGSSLTLARFGRRSYSEFEEDCDWLHIAEEILRENAGQRRPPKPEASQARKRSLLSCLRRAHEDQPHRSVKRTFTQPLLTRSCLLDMIDAAPHRHNAGDLANWTMAVCNRKHESGGHYVELGGSLRNKKIGSFVETGLNASMAPSGQLVMKMHTDKMPLTWKPQRSSETILPAVRKRLIRS